MISAMEQHEVGCPDLEALVISTEWILSLCAILYNPSISWSSVNFCYFLDNLGSLEATLDFEVVLSLLRDIVDKNLVL